MRKTTLTPHRLLSLFSRVMCILLFTLWGYIFITHMSWFFPPMPVPPVIIWIGQAAHFCLVASYGLFFWKEKPAILVMILSAFIYFFFVVASGGAIVYFLLSIFPAILYLIDSILHSHAVQGETHDRS